MACDSKSANSPDRSDARLDAIEQSLYEYLQDFQVPHRDVYSVKYCPECGENLTALRELAQRHFAGRGKTVALPPDVCLNCGLKHSRMSIMPE